MWLVSGLEHFLSVVFAVWNIVDLRRSGTLRVKNVSERSRDRTTEALMERCLYMTSLGACSLQRSLNLIHVAYSDRDLNPFPRPCF